MKNKILLILIIISVLANAQEKYIFLNQHTIYEEYNTDIRENQYVQTNDLYSGKSNLFEKNILSITYSTVKKHILNEYTFMPFHIRFDNYEVSNKEPRIVDGYQFRDIRTNITYGLSYIFRDTSKSFRPYVGLGVGFFFNYQEYIPKISNHYPRYFTKYSFRTFVNLGFKQKIYKNLYINVQLPIYITDYYILYDKLLNPSINTDDGTTKYNDFSYMPSLYLFKLGIGFKIN